MYVVVYCRVIDPEYLIEIMGYLYENVLVN